MVLGQLVVSVSKQDIQDVNEKESFVLLPPDNDGQSMHLNDEGQIMALINLDGTAAVPWIIAFCTLPLFLRKDHTSYFQLNIKVLFLQMDEYREQYVQCLYEADCPGAQYARRSVHYHAAYNALNIAEGGVVEET